MAFYFLAITACNNADPTIKPENDKQAGSLTVLKPVE
jgi:hypothetical protein